MSAKECIHGSVHRCAHACAFWILTKIQLMHASDCQIIYLFDYPRTCTVCFANDHYFFSPLIYRSCTHEWHYDFRNYVIIRVRPVIVLCHWITLCLAARESPCRQQKLSSYQHPKNRGNPYVSLHGHVCMHTITERTLGWNSYSYTRR